MGFFGKMLLWDSWRCSKMFVSCGAFVLNEASPAGGNPCVEERKGSDVVLKKLLESGRKGATTAISSEEQLAMMRQEVRRKPKSIK